MGRPTKARTVHSAIKQALASELLFGCLQHSGKVIVAAADGALTFRWADST